MMYNRYIPQSDGSYRRNRMQDTSQKTAPAPRQDPPRPQPPAPPCPPPRQSPPRPSQNRKSPPPALSASGFLRQLLPQNLDTGDLLVVILLLLMAGDCQEDKNTALLTLALYLFM